MKRFFQNTAKVSFASLIATISVSALFLCLITFASYEASAFQLFGKIVIAVSLPFLILNPLFGFIYSFLIKGKRKIVYILLHFICIATISVVSLIVFMFRYFVPFGP
ncbi:hypothetical protein ACFFHM_14380 [Halalkalibacter kiskunsagensis]|uniref:Uncharacterized protein n=1 Tax=Halalkalibacter kiskunsagensis TaxID=1548599 RepID=A0ABV6KIK4_9BACI